MISARSLPPLFLFFLFAATTAFADESLYENAIINGRRVEQNSLLAQSTVLIISVEGETCTGTIVGIDLVITAGHCVTRNGSNKLLPITNLVVDFAPYYNGNDQIPRASSVRLREIRLHPEYRHDLVSDAESPHDVALIRLAAPIRPGYKPAQLLPRSIRLMQGNSVVVAGYGDRSFTESSPDNRLLSFDFTVSRAVPDKSIVLLKASRAGGIGNGDSGGPAFVRANGTLYFWGVASSSEEEGWAEAGYENLEHYREWLERNGVSVP